MHISIAAIVGPTATGKSETAIEVAGLLNGEIISVDSMQIYRGMDIGTAKVKPQDRYTRDGRYIPHHMLDIVEPDVDYNVGRYQEEAALKIKEIHAKGKLPVLVGGTGLYYNALVNEYEFSPEEQNRALREQLREEAKNMGAQHLHDKLAGVDPKAAEAIHPHDLKRVIRALEVFYKTGQRISESTKNPIQTYLTAAAGLYLEREELYNNVNRRVDRMLEQGLIEEVKNLLEQGVKASNSSMQALGYKEVVGYLQGEYDLETCVELLKRDTRRFAKRQLTWFRRDSEIKWFNIRDYHNKTSLVEAIVNYIQLRLQIKVN